MSDSSPASFVWNMQPVIEDIDGNIEDLKHLIEIWLRQTPKLLADMRTALEIGDANKLSLAAHTLKGSLQILHADDAESTAQQIEHAGKADDLSIGSLLLSKLEIQIASMTPHVIAFMQEH